MTKTQIQLVTLSWRRLRGIDPALIADVFYSKLFLGRPDIRQLFPKNMEEQYQKLVDMLSQMVARLEQPDRLLQEIHEMGRRHKDYGVTPAHYALVGEALLWTLEKGLGSDWNAATAEAWTACYQLIADQMLEGAAE